MRRSVPKQPNPQKSNIVLCAKTFQIVIFEIYYGLFHTKKYPLDGSTFFLLAL